jgi:hypothetical protein
VQKSSDKVQFNDWTLINGGNMPEISVGRTVIYRLSAQDAAEINRRRTNSGSIADRIKQDKWPLGAQAHIGNEAKEGAQYPMVVVAVWSPNCVNGQVFLDGNDVFWALSRGCGDTPGTWQWPQLKPDNPPPQPNL